jgi:large subunit ribosomal protein L9
VQVILKADVADLGGKGEIVDVAPGYATNFLLPRGLALRATAGARKDSVAMSRSREKREEASLADAQDMASSLERAPVRITAKAGEDGTLYGSVGSTAVVAAVAEQLGVRLDRRKVPLPKPIKSLGSHEVQVRLHADRTATLQVEVVAGE